MLCNKVTHCAGHVSANTRPYQLHGGDREMGTAISCTKCNQMAGLIKKVGRSSSEMLSLCAAVFCLKIVYSNHNCHMFISLGLYTRIAHYGS